MRAKICRKGTELNEEGAEETKIKRLKANAAETDVDKMRGTKKKEEKEERKGKEKRKER